MLVLNFTLRIFTMQYPGFDDVEYEEEWCFEKGFHFLPQLNLPFSLYLSLSYICSFNSLLLLLLLLLFFCFKQCYSRLIPYVLKSVFVFISYLVQAKCLVYSFTIWKKKKKKRERERERERERRKTLTNTCRFFSIFFSHISWVSRCF